MTRRKEQRAEQDRAAIYARVSDKSQAEEDKTSISEQIADMEAYCERKGLTIVVRYDEVGKGWSKNRPAFRRMLADARDGLFDVIVCWKMDRLSRGMFPAVDLMEVIEAYPIRLESVMDPVDMKMFGIMAAIGKIELENFRERASMGKRGAAKQGRIPTGKVPFGYRIGADGKPEIVEEEAEVVRWIFRQYVREGLGSSLIVKELERNGVPTSKLGKRWHEAQIHRLLAREAYKGEWWYGRTRTVTTDSGKRVYERDRDEWVCIPFPPLVDEDIWERAQSTKRQRTNLSKRNTKLFYLLRGLVRCSECGLVFTARATMRNKFLKNDKVYQYDFESPRRYYKCNGMMKYRTDCREHPFIRAEKLDDLVWSEVKEVVKNPALIMAGMQSLRTDGDSGLEERRAKAERELRNVQTEEDKLITLYAKGKITEDQLDRQLKSVKERLEGLRARLDDYRVQESHAVQQAALMENIVEWTSAVGDRLDDLTDDERRELLQMVLDRVTIDGCNEVRITLAIPAPDLVAIEKQASYPQTASPCR